MTSKCKLNTGIHRAMHPAPYATEHLFDVETAVSSMHPNMQIICSRREKRHRTPFNRQHLLDWFKQAREARWAM